MINNLKIALGQYETIIGIDFTQAKSLPKKNPQGQEELVYEAEYENVRGRKLTRPVSKNHIIAAKKIRAELQKLIDLLEESDPIDVAKGETTTGKGKEKESEKEEDLVAIAEANADREEAKLRRKLVAYNNFETFLTKDKDIKKVKEHGTWTRKKSELYRIIQDAISQLFAARVTLILDGFDILRNQDKQALQRYKQDLERYKYDLEQSITACQRLGTKLQDEQVRRIFAEEASTAKAAVVKVMIAELESKIKAFDDLTKELEVVKKELEVVKRNKEDERKGYERRIKKLGKKLERKSRETPQTLQVKTDVQPTRRSPSPSPKPPRDALNEDKIISLENDVKRLKTSNEEQNVKIKELEQLDPTKLQEENKRLERENQKLLKSFEETSERQIAEIEELKKDLTLWQKVAKFLTDRLGIDFEGLFSSAKKILQQPIEGDEKEQKEEPIIVSDNASKETRIRLEAERKRMHLERKRMRNDAFERDRKLAVSNIPKAIAMRDKVIAEETERDKRSTQEGQRPSFLGVLFSKTPSPVVNKDVDADKDKTIKAEVEVPWWDKAKAAVGIKKDENPLGDKDNPIKLEGYDVVVNESKNYFPPVVGAKFTGA